MKNLKNIILDLGGVILNIDYKLTAQAFVQLGVKQFDSLYSKQKQAGLFDDFECGHISAHEFRNRINHETGLNLTSEEIDDAWNAMLLDLPASRIDFLEGLKKNFKLILLSNTNEIHFKAFSKIISQNYRDDLFDSLFDAIYYSHEIGMRKPHAEVFKRIVDQNNLIPEETLFIDDTESHLKGAAANHIHTLHLKPGDELTDLLAKAITV